jgi:hypothetical protein
LTWKPVVVLGTKPSIEVAGSRLTRASKAAISGAVSGSGASPESFFYGLSADGEESRCGGGM